MLREEARHKRVHAYDSTQMKCKTCKTIQKSETPLGPPMSRDQEGKCKKLFGVLEMFYLNVDEGHGGSVGFKN